MTETTLIDALDAAAKRLLEIAGFGDTVVGAEPSKVTLPEQVKAFEAVVKWAENRNELKPPDKKASDFERIQRQFSATSKRGRRTAAPEAHSDLNGAEPDAATNSDLFDA